MKPNFDRLREQAKREGMLYRESLKTNHEPRMYGNRKEA